MTTLVPGDEATRCSQPRSTSIGSLGALPASKQGVASAVNDTARELGSAIGIAVLGTILAATYRENVAAVASRLPAALGDALGASIAVTRSPQLAEGGPAAQQVLAAAQQAFVDGIAQAMTVAAVVVAVAAVAVFVLAPGNQRPGAADPRDRTDYV